MIYSKQLAEMVVPDSFLANAAILTFTPTRADAIIRISMALGATGGGTEAALGQATLGEIRLFSYATLSVLTYYGQDLQLPLGFDYTLRVKDNHDISWAKVVEVLPS